MPRAKPVPLTDNLVQIKKGEALPAPEPSGRKTVPATSVKRVAMTFRITEEAYERLRRMAFETRLSQQALVDQALDRLFAERGG
jgi:Ribbon-helix-helix domain